MKRKDSTAQMIGQTIQPIANATSAPTTYLHPQSGTQSDTHPEPLLQTALSQELGLDLGTKAVQQSIDSAGQAIEDFCLELWAKPVLEERPAEEPRYKIIELLAQDIGKRTFLAIEERTEKHVIMKLLLFCPDMAAEEAAIQSGQTEHLEYEPAAALPYLESFEVNTPLGDGLMLIKPCENPQALLKERETLNQPRLNKRQFNQRQSDALYREQLYREQQSTQLTEELSKAPVQSRSSVISTTMAHPTLAPKFTYSNLKIKATPQKLEVQLPESYVREGLLESPEKTLSLTEQLELSLAVVLATVVFVGGVVASTGSIPAGIVVAVLLPLIYSIIKGPTANSRRVAKIRVTSEPDGRAFVSLTSMGKPIRDRTGRINGAIPESRLHGSRLSIKAVKVSPRLSLSSDLDLIKAQLSFTFHNEDWHSQTLRIVGSYAEIRWLSHHLSAWGRHNEK